jgi:hypothetical protein
MNPWLSWVGPMAEWVRQERKPVDEDNLVLKAEKAGAATISASLEYYRALRDAASEAQFFQTYGNVFSLYIADKAKADAQAAGPIAEGRELPFVQEALASIAEGGYPEAVARVACLLARKGEPLMLSKLQMKQQLIKEYGDLLPQMAADEWRRVRGEQEIIVRYEPERALATLPQLLKVPGDKDRLVTLARQLLGDERVQRSEEQLAMISHIGDTLAVKRAAPRGAARRGKGRAARPGAAVKAVAKRRTRQ